MNGAFGRCHLSFLKTDVWTLHTQSCTGEKFAPDLSESFFFNHPFNTNRTSISKMHIILHLVRLETIDLGQQTHQDSADLENGSRKPSGLLLPMDPEELAPVDH